MGNSEIAELTRAIGRLEATTDGLSKQMAQSHEDNKELIGALRLTLETHERRLDGFDKDRTRIYTIGGFVTLLVSVFGIDKVLQWLVKS